MYDLIFKLQSYIRLLTMLSKSFLALLILFNSKAIAQVLPAQCAQISLYTACTTEARQRLDQCGQNLTGGVPNQTFYDCQCKEMTSIQTCFTYCPDSPEIQAQLPTEEANAKAWCNTADNMRKNTPTTTTSTSLSNTSSRSTSTSSTSSKSTVSGVTSTTTPTNQNQNIGGNNGVATSTTSSLRYGPSSTLNLASDGVKIEINLTQPWFFQGMLIFFLVLFASSCMFG